MCDIIFDQSARSIFARYQALVYNKYTWRLEIRNFSSHVEIFFNTRREISYLRAAM